uniref:Uncharacterized protein n=1 Tax=Oryza nivara TaxID=4536 RepID=A0A0E0HS25_ORYNI
MAAPPCLSLPAAFPPTGSGGGEGAAAVGHPAATAREKGRGRGEEMAGGRCRCQRPSPAAAAVTHHPSPLPTPVARRRWETPAAAAIARERGRGRWDRRRDRRGSEEGVRRGSEDIRERESLGGVRSGFREDKGGFHSGSGLMWFLANPTKMIFIVVI